MPAREVNIANHHPRLRLDRRAVTRVIHLLDAHFSLSSKLSTLSSASVPRVPSVPPGEISLVFLTDPALAQLHADFLADPTITDVITFEGNRALGVAGEICVSVDAALRHIGLPLVGKPPRASEIQTAFSAELTLYLVHGWLHLAGYDDLQPAKKRVMRRAEARVMELLRAHDCLPHFRLA